MLGIISYRNNVELLNLLFSNFGQFNSLEEYRNISPPWSRPLGRGQGNFEHSR